MRRAIYEDDVIKLLEKGWKSGIYPVASNIHALPSALSEWKKGKWVYAEDEYGIDGYHCDQCGFFVPWDYTHRFINYIEDYHYCPNCGAKMVDSQESEDKKKLSWLGKRCEDCGNKKCKALGELPKGYDCALWREESREE